MPFIYYHARFQLSNVSLVYNLKVKCSKMLKAREIGRVVHLLQVSGPKNVCVNTARISM